MTSNFPEVDIILLPLTIRMPPWPMNVRLASGPAFFNIVALQIFIRPAPPPTQDVRTIIAPPVFNAALIDAVVNEALFVETKVGLPPMLQSGPALLIVILSGSINHVPPSPLLAPTFTNPDACKLSLLDVSTKPPSPPSVPPLAEIDPRKWRYEQIQNADMDLMLQFHKAHIQNRPKLISIVGDRNKIDMEKLAKVGKVIEVELEDIFVD